MPSVGEIFNVTGVDVDSGVDVNGICVGAGVSAGTGVAVVGMGVAALWQAASKQMERRNEIIFFILVY